VASCRWVHGQSPIGKKGAAGEVEATGCNSTDRAKGRVKRHLLTDGKGVPLARVLSGANRADMKKLDDLLDAQVIEPPLVVDNQGQLSAPHLWLDRDDDYDACREVAAAHGYTSPNPAKASDAHPLPPPGDPARHPPRRWVVENTQAQCP
jgi:putative transposase